MIYPSREAARRIVEAVREVDGDDPGRLGRELVRREGDNVLGAIAAALASGADFVAELGLSVLLRRVASNVADETRAIIGDLADVDEPPWPEIRDALLTLLAADPAASEPPTREDH